MKTQGLQSKVDYRYFIVHSTSKEAAIKDTKDCIDERYKKCSNDELINNYCMICNDRNASFGLFEQLVTIILTIAFAELVEMLKDFIVTKTITDYPVIDVVFTIVYLLLFGKCISTMIKEVARAYKTYFSEYDIMIVPYEKQRILYEMKCRGLINFENEVMQ